MAQFVHTSIGYLNLDHILLVRVGVDKEAGLDLIQMSDGQTMKYGVGAAAEAEGPKYGVGAAAEAEGPKYGVGPAAEAEGPKYGVGAAAEAGGPAPEQKEAPAGGALPACGRTGGGEGSDAVPETPRD